MSPDLPLLDRLAQLPPVPIAELLALLERMERPQQDPLLAPLLSHDEEEGQRVVHPLLPTVIHHLQRKPELTCFQALLEALTGIWNAAVRAAVVARLRASGLPPDDLLLRLQALSPTLGFASENPEWSRAWLADPTTQDAVLVQQCVVRLILAVRGMAEARATALAESTRREGPASSS
jgi:hypothetical protein